MRWAGGMQHLCKIRKIREKKRLADMESESFGDPLLQRLMTGGWAEVGEMAEEIEKDEELIREVIATLRDFRAQSLKIRTEGEIAQDKESLQEEKKKMGKLRIHAQRRDELREACMALSIFRTLVEQNEGGTGEIKPKDELNPDSQKLPNGEDGAKEEQWFLRNAAEWAGRTCIPSEKNLDSW